MVDGLVVAVLNRPFSERFGVEFILEFSDNVEYRKVDVVEQLASFFGDRTPANVVLKSVNEHTVVWLNKTLAYAGCDDPEVRMLWGNTENVLTYLKIILTFKISWMRSKLTTDEPDDEYTLEDEFGREITHRTQASPAVLRHFENLGLVDAYVVLRGSCILKPPVPTDDSAGVGGRGGSGAGGGSIFHGIIPSGDYLMTFLVPAVIIVLMILLAILLALVLHRKRKEGKLNLFYSESLPPRVPVILQDELVDVDQNAYQKRTVVAATAAGGNQRLPEFERLIMPKNGGGGHNGQMEMSPRPTPAYQFRQS